MSSMVGEKSLQEIEAMLKDGRRSLVFRNSTGREVSILYWGLLVPPIIVSECWYGHEVYSALYMNLAEAHKGEAVDLSLFEIVETCLQEDNRAEECEQPGITTSSCSGTKSTQG